MRCYYSYGWLLATIIFCLDVQARDVKIVEGQQEEMKTQQWLDHDGYDDYYDGYYSGGWPLDDDMSSVKIDQDDEHQDEVPKEANIAVRGEKKRAHHPGPLLLQSIQNECFRSQQIPNEGEYVFCPFRNVSLTYEIRKQEESLSMGSFSHWSTQRVNDTIRLTQVYKHGFYCRMGDEHTSIVTFGCREDGEGEEEDHGFNVQGVEKGAYSRSTGQNGGGIVNGSMLRGEADYWEAEDEGCVYNLHFLLPFMCSEMPHVGMSVAVDRPAREGDEVVLDAMDGLAGLEVRQDQEQVLRQWAAWGVRLKEDLGGSESGAETESSSSSSSSASTGSDARVVSESREEEAIDNAAPTESNEPAGGGGGSCCGELATLKTSLRELGGIFSNK